MPMKGIDKAIDQLKRLEKVQAIASKTMQQWLILVGTEAAVKTPIDTSTLLNSQFKSQKNQTTVVMGKIGYSANYASYVHDQNIKQSFRRATAEKEFLLKAINETAEPRLKLLDREIRRFIYGL